MPRPPSPIPIRRRVESCGRYRRRDEVGAFRELFSIVAAYVAFGLLYATVARYAEPAGEMVRRWVEGW